VTRRAGDRGALRAGVHPAILPGGRHHDDVERRWGPLPNREPGRDSKAILEACAQREIDVLYLVGVDPLRDFPDGGLARRAHENVPVKVVQSLELGSLAPFADAFLPAAAFLEKDGHVTTWEGRGQRLRRVRDPEGLSLPDWEIFASLALASGGDLGFESLDELHEEMGELLAPTDAGITLVSSEPTGKAPERLSLFTYPLLVDEGRLSERADELKAALAATPFVEIHPDDAAAGSIVDGTDVVVATSAGESTLRVRVTEHVATGSVFIPFNQAGFQANQLLDGDFVASATVEPAAALVDAGTGGAG
ncbi:MAG: molybdopterin-dependent oxidoreductase, partial [Actinomycetota bacterium]|nr:molybdopterin-dependent oxidoreductase [Actinomycetota bacterium]